MKKLDKRKIIYLIYILVGAYVIMCFPLSGDDLLFESLKITKWNDVLKYALYFGNGRVLGNIGILFLSKSFWLRLVCKLSMLVLEVVLLHRLLNIKSSKYNFLLSNILILLILAPGTDIFRQVYVWSAGFQNYLPPVVLMIVSLYLLKKEDCSKILCFLSAIVIFIACFYSENSSIVFVEISFMLFIYLWMENRKKCKNVIMFLAFPSIIGFIMMMMFPRYLSVANKMSGYRDVNKGIVTGIIRNFKIINESFINNYMLIVSLCVIGIVMVYRYQINKKTLFVFGGGIGYSLLYTRYIEAWITPNALAKIVFNSLFSVIIIGTILFVLFRSRLNNKHKKILMFVFMSGIFSYVPLLFVTPIGARTFYFSYIIFVVGTILAYKYMLEEIDFTHFKMKEITIFLVMLNIIFLLIYSLTFKDINYGYNYRNKYIQTEIKKEKRTIDYPLLPHQEFLWNDGMVLRSIEYKYYRKKHGDVTFNIMSWDAWYEKNILKIY